jgi:predicted acyl esterase
MTDGQHKIEIRDGMHVEWDVPIPMGDGVVLRADIMRPIGDGKFPVILTYGPYAKGLAFQEGYKSSWHRMIKSFPEVLEGSSNIYQSWELVDPEKWVPDGYLCLRIDSRGAGRSPGVLDVYSPRETQDIYECIEWAAVQPWSSGKVGINGISYYAVNQWLVGSLQPPSLAAMCIWEGYSNFYREQCRTGGILNDFIGSWSRRQVVSMQHGQGERAPRSLVTGELVAGPETLPEEVLAANRANTADEVLNRHFEDEFHLDRTPKFDKITAPLLSSGNWGGVGLHTRGNIEGYVKATSTQKWLEMHGDTHFSHFYTNYGIALQKKFLGYFLKGEDTGWDKQPPVLLNIRHPGEVFVPRAEQEWPLARTQYTKFHLDPATMALTDGHPAVETTLAYEALGDGLYFSTPPLAAPLEITGHIAVKLFLSSETSDASTIPRARRSCSTARTIRARRSASAGCAPRTASSMPRKPCPTGPITAMTRPGRWSRASRSNSTSRSGRPASSYPRAIASRSTCAARITSMTARRPTSRIRPTRCTASARSPITTRSTGRRRSSAARTRCTSRRTRSPT